MKIVIDAGHGPNTPGKRAPDDSMREYHFNSAVARYAIEMLKEYECQTLVTHEDGRDVPLSERTRKANDWKANVYVSIHANAAGSTWSNAEGVETFVYTTATGTAVTLANVVQKKLVVASGLRDRGVKRGDFHVLRETKMPAILIEFGFMDNKRELALLKTDGYRRKCAEVVVKSLVEVYGLVAKKPAYQTAKLEVNGKKIDDGVIIDGVTYFPSRPFAAAFGAEIAWDNATKTTKVTTKEAK
ncbi:N-acetylmuramoyl-L-alanine amidase [Paenibacillus sp. SC116]|uniref:N-acetylmuramoyl-L-alanine amidase n=1 Tax=Paenibacillus sp. SC116 TaxID=2968986 RepID=UPI00215B2ADA|nr:N-acetylmuramoyl-L-alanine amidase [Paenibacillus sp. SC116]MCR8843065.1 N-acetylmuramoyl-L-alanine amidase [Paenibacillus sp. SC116]